MLSNKRLAEIIVSLESLPCGGKLPDLADLKTEYDLLTEQIKGINAEYSELKNRRGITGSSSKMWTVFSTLQIVKAREG